MSEHVRALLVWLHIVSQSKRSDKYSLVHYFCPVSELHFLVLGDCYNLLFVWRMVDNVNRRV